MPSESARMSSAAEGRFRVEPGATVARTVSVAALDPATDDVIARLAERAWTGVKFFPASAVRDRSGVVDDIAEGDLVVMVTTSGADASAAEAIGRACSDRRVHTATFVIRADAAPEEALSRTLAHVRPWSLMVVIASDESYIEDVLRSFR